MRGTVPIKRRMFLLLATALGLAGATFGSVALALAQKATATPNAGLMAAPPLPDIWMGSNSAPVTVIEYASLDCSHCAAFHAETWPTLKSKYIDTGKLHFVLREFPLGPLATAGFMLGRCAGPD